MKLERLWSQAAKGIVHNGNTGNALAGSRIDDTDQVTCVQCVHKIRCRTVHGLSLENTGLESVPYAVPDIFAARLQVNDLDFRLAISVRPRETGRACPFKGLAFVRAVLGEHADKLHGQGGALQYLVCS